MSAVKQVLVVRKDLNMRTGKLAAQVSHASEMFWASQIRTLLENPPEDSYYKVFLKPSEEEWLRDKFTKVCLQVNSESELDEIYIKAKEAGLTAFMVIDSGKTEFHGIPTKTVVAIGPNNAEDINKITGHLKLM